MQQCVNMAVKNEMLRKQQRHKVNNWPDYNLSLKKSSNSKYKI